eukprot:7388905-Prymnesium_polylepis.2
MCASHQRALLAPPASSASHKSAPARPPPRPPRPLPQEPPGPRRRWRLLRRRPWWRAAVAGCTRWAPSTGEARWVVAAAACTELSRAAPG